MGTDLNREPLLSEVRSVRESAEWYCHQFNGPDSEWRHFVGVDVVALLERVERVLDAVVDEAVRRSANPPSHIHRVTAGSPRVASCVDCGAIII